MIIVIKDLDMCAVGSSDFPNVEAYLLDIELQPKGTKDRLLFGVIKSKVVQTLGLDDKLLLEIIYELGWQVEH